MKACANQKDLSKSSKRDTAIIVGLLKACANQKDLVKGSKLHRYIQEHEFLRNSSFVASALVSMYARCGAVTKAQEVLKALPSRNVVAWNALIAGYLHQGQGEEALKCFDSMQCDGHSPDVVTFTCALKACANIGAAVKGEQIHEKIASLGLLEKNIILSSTLVDTYARCGALAKARQVVREIPDSNVVTWNALLTGYVQWNQGREALECFDIMQQNGHPPDAVTFTCALKACGSIRAGAKGEQLHHRIVSMGMLEKNIVLGSSLVDMYARCGAVAKARQVLEELPVRDVVSWTALIAGYAQHGEGKEALRCFDNMQHNGHCPDTVTFTCALKACGSIGAVGKGEQIHEQILSLSLLDKSIALGSTLVDMYARCGALSKAHKVIIELSARNTVTWNAIIGGYAQQGKGEEALECFDSMQHDGCSPNEVTFICVLKACGSIGAAVIGEQIHKRIVSLGLLKKNIILGNSLVDMYAGCGALAKAQEVFAELPVRSVVSWTALIAGYAQQGQGEEALKYFESMENDGLFPNEVTFTCVLKACGSIGATAKGEQIHDKIASLGMLEGNIVLGGTLVDMYVRSGALAKAEQVFKQLFAQDVISWTTLVGGYALQGQSEEAANCFEKMPSKGLKPNSTTLACMLNSLSHSGLSDKAEILYSVMINKYGIAPDLEHLCCLIDLFGRAGKFDKTLHVIEKMTSTEYLPVWIVLLGACQKWGEVEIGRLAFEHALHLDKCNGTIYVCMANIYRAAGMEENQNKIEVMRMANKVWRLAGC